MNPSGNTVDQLVLCDNEKEKEKWIGNLTELLQVYNKTHGSKRKVRICISHRNQSFDLLI